MEGSSNRVNFAQEVIKRSALMNVKVHTGQINEELKEILQKIRGRYVAFVDADHRYGPTIEYVSSILDRAGEEAVIILDDIYWSREMNRAWNEIIKWPRVRISIDLFQMGILLLRRDLKKAHLKIKF